MGLVHIPTARMDDTGTIRTGYSYNKSYSNVFLGFQLATPLYVSLRQTGTAGHPFRSEDTNYPGVDFKLRLLRESDFTPAISLGAQSAIGHKRTAGEYLVASKRYNNFDFTAGLGWGRFGTAAHFKNPLGYIANHFDQQRPLDGSLEPNEFGDWFTGENVGLFAGVEYFTSLDGLSVKAEYGADRYSAERLSGKYEPVSPWSIALNYTPKDWMDISIGAQGTDSVMARLSFQNNITKWPLTYKKSDKATPLNPHRSDASRLSKAVNDAAREDISIVNVRSKNTQANAVLHTSYPNSISADIGRSARHIANNAPADIETIALDLRHMGLRGPKIKIMRRDLEAALIHHNGSPEEIWRNTILESDTDIFAPAPHSGLWKNVKLTLENEFSPYEIDTGPLFRTAALIETRAELPVNFYTGFGVRLNLLDNLHRIEKNRPLIYPAVRNDIKEFTDHTIALDRKYLGWMGTPINDTHIKLQGGYLEEMYAGYGGEILYRPFGKTFAIGADAWHVFRRNPYDPFALSIFDTDRFTGHVNGYYEFPNSDLTASLSVGEYLGGDFGATAGLIRNFDNGAKLRGYVTSTDSVDNALLNFLPHLEGGIEFSVPIGSVKYLPDATRLSLKAVPLGRETGQRLNTPDPLYDASEPISYRTLTRSWSKILD